MKKIYTIMFFVSISLVIAAIVVIAVFGLKLGADFKGGSVMEISFESTRPSSQELSDIISTVNGTSEVSVSLTGDRGAIIRLGNISEDVHQNILLSLRDKIGNIREDRFDSIGPTIGQELKQKSITAMVLLLIAVVSYIAFVFRKMSKVLSPWAMGMAAILALVHDVVIPVGIFALLGEYLSIEISAVFVAAALTILGYSLSDTVVVFDRLRENVLRYGSREDFGVLVHKSVMQTLSRSLNTTFTTLLSLLAIFFFGGESIKYFSLAMIIGLFLGAYSSIFVASPVLVWISSRRHKSK